MIAIANCLISMKGYDPEGQLGPKKPLPDSVQILEPPVDKIPLEPSSEQREPVPAAVAPPADESFAAQDSSYQEGFAEQPASF